jgi:arabinogalactan endo-1,4-beta-galactosidase
MWEVWNEPNLIQFWPMRPWPSSYVALLRAAHGAIKKADPRAKVVLAALPNYSWRLLLQIYRVAGARRLFDVVDVHAYTKNPAGVIQILGFVRTSMKLGKDTNKQLIAGEVGWLSSGNQTARQYDFQTTQAGQARNLRTLLPLLAANRKALRLSAFYWYTWMGDEFRGANPFNFSGLVALQNGQVKTKPALKAFNQTARALER